MTNFLIRRFVDGYERINEPKVRERYGMLGGTVGIVCNLLLFLFKIVAGMMSGAISIIADAFNNLSDAGSSIVTVIGFKMAGKPPDPEHPFGHGRIEYLSGLFISIMIIFVGTELFRAAVQKILVPEEPTISGISIAILIASIITKFWMAAFNKNLGMRIRSAAMEATAADSIGDCVATTVVLIGLGINFFAGINIDGFAGVAVALFIIYTGVMTAKDTLQPLLGQAPERALIEKIEQMVMGYYQVIGMHDLVVHDYGPGRMFISLHVEVPASMDMLAAHELVDGIEIDLRKQVHCEVTIHMDPIILDDPRLTKIRSQVKAVIENVDVSCSMHDFRMTTSHHGFNLIFDVVVPKVFSCSDKEVKQRIVQDLIKIDSRYNAVIKIDHPYV